MTHVMQLVSSLPRSVIYIFLMISTLVSNTYLEALCPGELTLASTSIAGTTPRSLAFSPNNQTLTVGHLNENSLYTYGVNQTNGVLTLRFIFGGDNANFVTYSPNGKFFATASIALNRLSIYSVDPVGAVFAFITFFGGGAQTNGANYLAFSPDSRLLAVSSQNTNAIAMYLIDQTTGLPTFVGSFTGSPVLSAPVPVAFSPDGRFLSVGYRGSDTLRTFQVDQATGNLTQVPGSDVPTNSLPDFLQYSPDGRSAALANQGSPLLDIFSVDQNTGIFTPIQNPTGLVSGSLSYAPSGGFAVVSSNTASIIRVFTVDQNTGLFSFLEDVSVPSLSESVKYSPNGKFVAFAAQSTDQTLSFTTDSAPILGTITAAPSTICSGSTSTLSVTLTGGTQPYTITWSDIGNQTGNSPITRTVTPSTTTPYSITAITDSAACAAGTLPAPVTVTVNQSPTAATLTASQIVICSGNTSTLTATASGGTAPYTITWSDGVTQTGNSPLARTVAPSIDTTFSLTSVIDANGCALPAASLPAPVTITVNPSPTAATLSASPITICSGTTSVLKVTITGGTAPYTITWSDIGNQTGASPLTRTVAPPIDKTFSLTSIVDANGCVLPAASLPAPVTVAVNPSPTAATLDVSKTTICSGDTSTLTVSITGGTPPYTVLWPDIGTQTGPSPIKRVVSPPTNRTFVVASISDANGCVLPTVLLPGPVTITVNQSPTAATLTASQTTLCSGDSSTLTTTVSGGTAPYTIIWSDGVTQTGTSPITRLVTPPNTKTFSITSLVDDNGCALPVSALPAPITITVNQSPTSATLNASQTTLCLGDTATLTLAISDGVAPYSVIWSDGFSQSGNSPLTRVVSPTVDKTFSVVSVVSADGCALPTSALPGPVTITVNPSPTAATLNASQTTICSNDSATLAVTVTGGVAPYTISWSDGVTQTGVSPIIRTVSPSSTKTFSLTSITDLNGCSLSASLLPAPVTITVNPSPTGAVLTASPGTICLGGSSRLTITVADGTAPYTVLWSDGVTQVSNSPVTRVVQPTSDTLYSAIITDSVGCSIASNAVTIDVTDNALPTQATTACGRPITFSVNTCLPATLVSVGNPVAPKHGVAVVVNNQINYTPNANYSGPDSFSYTVTNEVGTTSTSTVTMTVLPLAFLTTGKTGCNLPLTLTVDTCGATATITGVTQPKNGKVTFFGKTITYTPNVGFSGGEQFTYTIRDSSGNTSTAPITLSVCPVPGRPTKIGDFTTLVRPSAIDFTGTSRLAAITDLLSDRVQLYNIVDHGIATTPTEEGPADVKFLPNTQLAVVANSKSNSITVYRYEREARREATESSNLLRRKANKFVKLASFPTLKRPQRIAIRRNDILDSKEPVALTSMFIALSNTDSNAITVYRLVNQATGQLVKVGDFATQSAPLGLVYSPDGRTLLVANSGSNTITAYNVDANTGVLTRMGQTQTQRRPVSVDYSSDGRFATVANRDARSLQVFSADQLTARLTAIQTVSTGGAPTSVRYSPDGNFVAATVQSAEQPTEQESSPLRRRAGRLELYRVTRERRTAELAAQALAATHLELSSVVSTQIEPADVAFTPNGQLIGVVNAGSNSVSVYDTNATAFAQPTTLAIPCCQEITFTPNAYGEGIRVIAVGPAGQGQVTASGLEITYKPNSGFSGVDTFEYTIQDDLGNRSTSTIQITVGGSFAVTLTASPAVTCSTAPVQLALEIVGGDAPFTVEWSDGVVQTTSSSRITRTVTPTATTVYSAVVVQANGTVTSSPTVTVTVKSGPTVTLSASQLVVLPRQRVLLTATPTGKAPFTLQWSDGVIERGMTGPVTRQVRPTDTTVYTVRATDAQGCVSSQAQVTVNVLQVKESALIKAIRDKYC